MKLYFKKLDKLHPLICFEILKLRQEIFCIEQNCLYPDIDETDKISIHAYLEVDNAVAAYTRIYQDDEGIHHIGRICTKLNQRKTGLARRIIEESIAYVKNLEASAIISISAQLHLERYYQSLGFVSQGVSYFEDGIPHIKMIHKS